MQKVYFLQNYCNIFFWSGQQNVKKKCLIGSSIIWKHQGIPVIPILDISGH